MGKFKEMQIEMDNEPSPTEIDREIVRNMSDEEYSSYKRRHLDEIIGSYYLKFKFDMCGICENCAEARALECYTKTPYVHREDCVCGKNENRQLLEVHYGRRLWEVKSVTVCDSCFWKFIYDSDFTIGHDIVTIFLVKLFCLNCSMQLVNQIGRNLVVKVFNS